MDEAFLIEFLKQYQKKYSHITEIQRITKELGDALSRNDRVAAQLLLGMRGEEMEGADLCDRNIQILLDSMGNEDRRQAETYLNEKAGAESAEAENAWVKKIRDLQKKMKSILQDTIQYDKVINRKLGGENSFYSV